MKPEGKGPRRKGARREDRRERRQDYLNDVPNNVVKLPRNLNPDQFPESDNSARVVDLETRRNRVRVNPNDLTLE